MFIVKDQTTGVYVSICFNMFLQEMRIDVTHQSIPNIGCTKGFKSKILDLANAFFFVILRKGTKHISK
jgi:hypothetical protein